MSSRGYKLNKVFCPKHPNEDLIDDYHSGAMVCSACGLVVLDQVIDVGAEWRSFTDDTRTIERSRVGGPENSFFSSTTNLYTTIERSNGKLDSYGNSIFKRTQARSVDKALMAAFKQIYMMADRINLPESITHHACYLYQKVYKKMGFKGNLIDRDAKTAACLYLACRKESCPRTSKEICAIGEISRKEIHNAARWIIKSLNLNLHETKADDLIPRLCGKLYLPNSVKRSATQIAQKVSKLTSIKYQSETIAAASIYLATRNSNEHQRTQRNISECAGLCPNTISRSLSFINTKLLN